MPLFDDDEKYNAMVDTIVANRKGRYGTNQKKAGDTHQKDMLGFLREKYPHALIIPEKTLTGSSDIRSAKTGKWRTKTYRADIIFECYILSCKIQYEGGTTKNKIAEEILKIVNVMRSNPQFKHAYIILKGFEVARVIEEEYKYVTEYIDLYEKYREYVTLIKDEDFRKIKLI